MGQILEVGPTDGYQFEFSAMFDRVTNPARGETAARTASPDGCT